MCLLNGRTKIGNYVKGYDDYIGGGAYGEIYCVKANDKPYALKIDTDPNPTGEWNEFNFLEELKDNENIISTVSPVHDDFEIKGNLYRYFVMEYIESTFRYTGGDTPIEKDSDLYTFHEVYCGSEEKIPINEVMDIMKQICNGMVYCHNKAILHNDLKLDNIMLKLEEPTDNSTSNKISRAFHKKYSFEQNIVVKIIDFGKATMADRNINDNKVKGHEEFTPPDSEQNTTKKDVFSIGVIFYKLLTNNSPYVKKEKEIIGDATRKDRSTPIYNGNNKKQFEIVRFKKEEELKKELESAEKDIPGISEIVLKSLKKDSEYRYKNAGELLKEIKKLEERSTLNVLALIIYFSLFAICLAAHAERTIMALTWSLLLPIIPTLMVVFFHSIEEKVSSINF